MQRRLDDLGRIVIPKEMRDALGWESGDAIQLHFDGRMKVVILSSANETCKICNFQADPGPSWNLWRICSRCEQEIRGGSR